MEEFHVSIIQGRICLEHTQQCPWIYLKETNRATGTVGLADLVQTARAHMAWDHPEIEVDW